MKATFCLLAILSLSLSGFSQAITTKRIDQYNDRTATADPNDLFFGENNTLTDYWNQTRASVNRQFVAQLPNFWAGATNVVDLNVANHNNGDLYYSTRTPIQILGVINKALFGSVQTVTLTVLNIGTTNVGYTLPPELQTRDGTRSGSITNGQAWIISIRYHPALGITNSVSCPNY